MELWAHHACLEIEHEGDGAGVTGGVAEIYPSVGTRFPLGCTDGSLVSSVQDKDGATPCVEISGQGVVRYSCELFKGAESRFVEGQSVVSCDYRLYCIRSKHCAYHVGPFSFCMQEYCASSIAYLLNFRFNDSILMMCANAAVA